MADAPITAADLPNVDLGGQPDAHARPLDADGDDPQPVVCAEGMERLDEAGRMRASPLYDRIVDVMEELVKFTWLTRSRSAYLTDRHSERVESAEALARRVSQRSI